MQEMNKNDNQKAANHHAMQNNKNKTEYNLNEHLNHSCMTITQTAGRWC